MKEIEKMKKGYIYDPNDKQLVESRNRARSLCRKINKIEKDNKRRNKLLKDLLPNVHPSCYITGPIYVDYGFNIYIGENSYFNFNSYILDVCEVRIGKNVFFGPNTNILTACHPLVSEERIPYFDKEKGYWTDKEYGKKIVIEDNVWIGGNVTILGGVTIGKNTVVGAGSLVSKSLPSDSVCYGNPARAIRKITKEDSIYLKKELFE